MIVGWVACKTNRNNSKVYPCTNAGTKKDNDDVSSRSSGLQAQSRLSRSSGEQRWSDEGYCYIRGCHYHHYALIIIHHHHHHRRLGRHSTQHSTAFWFHLIIVVIEFLLLILSNAGRLRYSNLILLYALTSIRTITPTAPPPEIHSSPCLVYYSFNTVCSLQRRLVRHGQVNYHSVLRGYSEHVSHQWRQP